MSLDTNNSVSSVLEPSFYMVRGYPGGTLQVGVNPTGGADIDANISSITITSDASPGSVVFSVHDPDVTDSTSTLNYVPCVGEEIVVKSTSVTDKASDWADSDMEIMFKGIIVSRTRERSNGGINYSIEAQDMKKRLQDEVIKKKYNEVIDNINSPNFDTQGELLDVERWTVAEIIRDIVYTANSQLISQSAYEPLIYFKWDNYSTFKVLGGEFFDFSQVSDLESYIPDVLDFDNVTVLEAIYRTVSAAGSYRMTYDPVTDHIVFTKTSIYAEEAGPERLLFYATADKVYPNNEYASDVVQSSSLRNSATGRVNIVADNSTVNNSDMATVMRPYGGEIDWYSGHFYIDPAVTDFEMIPNASGQYNYNNYNWDGYKYVFMSNALEHIYPSGQYVIVGMPLYPQWDPGKGYEPAKVILDDVFSISEHATYDSLSSRIRNTWAGDEEVQGFTVNDALFSKSTKLFRLQDAEGYNTPQGLVYEAWFPWQGECLYCDGSGAVEDRAPWNGKEDLWFGDSRDVDGNKNRNNLTPFDYDFTIDASGNRVPQNHPWPHKNICPACRGTGQEPKFKVTNINQGLVDMPPSEARVEGALVGGGTPLTWRDTVNEFAYNYGPQVQVEETYLNGVAAPVFMDESEIPEHPLAGLKCISHDAAATDDDREIYPSGHKIKTLYKTYVSVGDNPVQIDHIRGNVVFESRYAIQCSKDIRMIEMTGLASNHNLPKKIAEKGYATSYESQESITSIPAADASFWRPARAWITCTFKRDNYHNMFGEWDTDDFDEITRLGRNPDVITGDSSIYPSGIYPSGVEYMAKSSIIDNRAVFEVFNEDDFGGTCTVRPVVRGVTLDEYGWTIYPEDAMALPVPSGANYTWDASDSVIKEFRDREYFFPTGAMHVTEALKHSEVTPPFTIEDVGSAMSFPKKIEWVLRDDRPLMLKHAIRELEKQNNKSITGNVVVRGKNYDLSQGMGFVEFSDGDRANIVKMVHNFNGPAYMTTLELTTEEFRLGEKTEKDKDTIHLLQTKAQKINRIAALEFASKQAKKRRDDADKTTQRQYGPIIIGKTSKE